MPVDVLIAREKKTDSQKKMPVYVAIARVLGYTRVIFSHLRRQNRRWESDANPSISFLISPSLRV